MTIKTNSIFCGLLLIIPALETRSFADTVKQECGYINCYDECTGGYLFLYGDTCQPQWDLIRQCWSALATCQSNPPQNCGSVVCYDACASSSNVYSGNTCVNVWDYARSCYTARGECRYY